MFAARGIFVSLSVFLIVYCALSLSVLCAWRRVWLRRHRPARRIATLLFALRMFPLLAAAVITAAFTIPSFLLLEPRAIDEPLGGIPLVLGMCGAALGILGAVNGVLAVRKASRAISAWTTAAQLIEAGISVPVLRISPVVSGSIVSGSIISRPVVSGAVVPSPSVPAMTATGIIHPRVLLSHAAESVLTPRELRIALNHEVAHVRRRDNLRKLLLRFVIFPGMSGLEAAWLDATELAADDAAVSNAGEALDLAAALIKVSRLGMVRPPDLTAALVHGPASFMTARIERLIAWSDECPAAPRKFSAAYGLAAALATAAVFAVTYSQLLAQVHTATEWLVR